MERASALELRAHLGGQRAAGAFAPRSLPAEPLKAALVQQLQFPPFECDVRSFARNVIPRVR